MRRGVLKLVPTTVFLGTLLFAGAAYADDSVSGAADTAAPAAPSQSNVQISSADSAAPSSSTTTNNDVQGVKSASSGTDTEEPQPQATAPSSSQSSDSGKTSSQTDNPAIPSSTDSEGNEDAVSSDSSDEALVDGGIYRIETDLDHGKAVDITGGSTENEASAQIYDESGSLAQDYRLKALGDGWYTVENYHSGKVLDVRWGKADNGTPVQQYESNGSDAQQWKIVHTDSGLYYFIPRNAQDKRLDVAGGLTVNGTRIQIFSANGTRSQLFRLLFDQRLTDVASGKIASSIDPGLYEIVSSIDGNKVVDIRYGSGDDGANVQIWDANSSESQKFYIGREGQNLYSIESLINGKLLDVAGGSVESGANVQQFHSNGSLAQLWYFTKSGSGYTVHSLNSGLVLDVLGGIASNGQNVQQYVVNNSLAQLWKLVATHLVNDGVYVLQSKIIEPMVLDIAGGGTWDGANAQLYRSNGSTAQQFRIAYIGNDSYAIYNVNSGKALDVTGGSLDGGANVQQYSGNGSEAQQWHIYKDYASGAYTIISVRSGQALDVSGGSRFSGTNVQQWYRNGSLAQLWNLRDGSWSFYQGVPEFYTRIIHKAEEYEGWPYVWGGRGPSQGFDCAGLVMYCSNQVYGTNFDLMYTNAEMLLWDHCDVISESEARPGDLVFYKGTYGDINMVSHVVIYCGDGVMYGAGDPIGYEHVDDIENMYGQPAERIYARIRL